MEPTRIDRKLTAILSADVKGYSRLMGEDEVATIRTLTAYRELMGSVIHQHRGRVVDTPGDNLLADFGSVVDALTCAMEVQRELTQRNAELPDQRKMEFRIGINLGDVVVEGERIYGDGVNIAARLESLAEGGGISISGMVYDQIVNKLDLSYAYQGEQTVRNIARPVRVYRVQLDAESVVSATDEEQPPALPLPDKPSIAVLPYTNLSADPEQEYFSDGMTDDIITDLSKISGLFVIARHSAFTYKGKAVKVEEVSRDLGVRYVLEGSVRRAGNRVRINVQLIDASTGGHLWAERYDRELEDIFALQDDITQKIVFALKVMLTTEEQTRFRQSPTTHLDAYDCFLRGMEFFWRLTRESNTQARQMYEQAIGMDPTYAAAYAWRGYTHLLEWILQWRRDPQSLQQAFELTQQAVALDDAQPIGRLILGNVYLWGKREHEQALAEAEQAIALNPNFAQAYAHLGNFLVYAGRPQAAIEMIERAMRLDPHYPPLYLSWLGHAYRLTGQAETAIAILQRAVKRNPNYLYFHLHLVVTYSDVGREDAARAEAAEVLRINPKFVVEGLAQILPFKDPAVRERYLDALRKAGVPE